MLDSRTFKVVQISASLDPELGGPHKVVDETHKFLQEKYLAQLLIFGTSVGTYKNSIVNSTSNNNRYGFVLGIPRIEARLAIKQATIILIHGYYLWSTLIALYFSSTRNIFLMPHGSLELYQAKKGKFRKIIFKKLCNLLLKDRSIHFLVGSSSESVSVRQSFPNSKISVVGLGVKLSNAIKINSRIHSPIKLFCLCRITNKKRIDLCIRAMSKLNEGNSEYHLDIYGSGDHFLENELKELVEDLNLGEQVSFKGHVDGELKDLAIQNSDILLLPSENENFAVAVAESIAFGKPVVVSKFVAMHEFVDTHSTGLTIEALDVDELVCAIKDVTNKFSTFQENCIASAPLLAWEEVIKNWFQVFENNLNIKK
jgi:glycosyltransferase involved in cell wall biosynthesis